MAMSFVSLANGCRLCLKIASDNLDIFSYDKQKKSLLQNIWKYFSIQVLMEDFFPKKICQRCLKEIEQFTAFCAEVEQVQKRMQNMVACIPPDFHRTIAGQNSNVPDLEVDPLKVEDEPDVDKKTPLDATENRKPVAYGILQTQPNNPNPVMSLLIMGDDSTSNASIQSQLLNSNPVLPFLATGDKVVQNNKVNTANVQTPVLNHNPIAPLLIRGGNPGVQNPNHKLQLLPAGVKLTAQNNVNVQTPVLNPNAIAPLLVRGGNPSVQNPNHKPQLLPAGVKLTAQNNVKVQTPVLNPNAIAPLLVRGGNPSVQNPNHKLQLLPAGVKLTAQNNVNVQTPVLNPNPIAPLLVTHSNPGVQNSKVNTHVQTRPSLPAGFKLTAQNNVNLQTPVLNPNAIAPLLVTHGNPGVQELPLLPLKNKKVKKSKTDSQILPLLLSAGNSCVQNNTVNQQIQYLVHNPVSPLLVVGSNPNVPDTKVNNPTTGLVNPNSIPRFLVINNDTNIENNTSNAVTFPLEKSVLVVSGNPEVQNEKVSSTNSELLPEDSQCSKEASPQNKIAFSADTSKTNVPVEESNNTESGPEDDVENFRSLAADPDFCTARDNELAAFYNFTCFACEEAQNFKNYTLMDKHCLAEHGKNAVILCCNRELVGESALLQHMKKHKQRVKCPECGKELSMPWTLKCHMLRHLPQERRPFKCKKCGKGFAMECEVQKHQEVHLSENEKKRYVCDICGKKLSSSHSVVNHRLYFHQRIQKVMCHICPKTFSTVSALNVHLTTHYSKPESEKCPQCGKMLKNKMTLRTHMLLHNSKKTYPCPHCDKVCKFANRLREHLLCHQDLWPHQCRFCKKLFKRKAGLKKHMMVHTGEQPYQCPYCSRTFATRGNCNSHKQRMHIRRNANKKPDVSDTKTDESKTKIPKRKKGDVTDVDSDSITCKSVADDSGETGDTDTSADINTPEDSQNVVKSKNNGIADEDDRDKKYYTRNGNQYEMAELNKHEMVTEEDYSVADLNKSEETDYDAAEDSKLNVAEERINND